MTSISCFGSIRTLVTRIPKKKVCNFVGGVVSPVLANIYLHQMDLYWWTHYGNLDRKVKERRRQAYQGNCALIRYADDWLLLTNGSKQEAYRLREEFQAFLAAVLQLELAVEKTHVTH